jgi:hypothetical protein
MTTYFQGGLAIVVDAQNKNERKITMQLADWERRSRFLSSTTLHNLGKLY